MNNDNFGFDKDRFPNLTGEQFDCQICVSVAKEPQECTGCGNLFCKTCMDSWLTKKKECPNRCNPTQNKITIISKALSRIYNDLDIKCIYFDKCQKTLKLSDIVNHEQKCQIPQCKNYDICQKQILFSNEFCDQSCSLFFKIKQTGGNQQLMLTEIKQFLSQFQQKQENVQSVVKPQIQSVFGINSNSQHAFRWSQKNKGTGIEVTDNNLKIFLKESSYMFRTIISDTPLYNGLHYWEIIADDRTENELKIGLVTKQDFNYNSSFSDAEYGYAYYGLGQLRHNSNATGQQYGKRFKKEGVLGCFLNMNKGEFSFALNGEFLGLAFSSEALKKGPILAAVSLLHCAGCSINSSKQVPNYFPQ